MGCPDCKQAQRALASALAKLEQAQERSARLADRIERWYRMGEPRMAAIVKELRDGQE